MSKAKKELPVEQEETTSECQSCLWWQRLEQNGEVLNEGSCCRFPPTVVVYITDGSVRSVLPVTEHNHYCGEFDDGVDDLDES